MDLRKTLSSFFRRGTAQDETDAGQGQQGEWGKDAPDIGIERPPSPHSDPASPTSGTETAEEVWAFDTEQDSSPYQEARRLPRHVRSQSHITPPSNPTGPAGQRKQTTFEHILNVPAGSLEKHLARVRSAPGGLVVDRKKSFQLLTDLTSFPSLLLNETMGTPSIKEEAEEGPSRGIIPETPSIGIRSVGARYPHTTAGSGRSFWSAKSPTEAAAAAAPSTASEAPKAAAIAFPGPSDSASQSGLESKTNSSNTDIPWSEIKIIKKIGQGSFGSVFRATCARFPHGDIALKVAFEADEGASVADIEKEFTIQASIPPHPNVVRVIGTSSMPFQMVGEEPRQVPALCMEFVDGTTVLAKAMEKELSGEEVLSYTLQAARGLWHLHQQRLVHRDVACRNLLLTADGVVKVADFGLARQVDKKYAMGATRSTVGPVKWMPIEYLQSQMYSDRGDVYMLGCAMFEMCSRGEEPWGTDTTILQAFHWITQGYCPGIPVGTEPDLALIMNVCWTRVVAERPRMSHIIKLLEAALERRKQQRPILSIDDIKRLLPEFMGSDEQPKPVPNEYDALHGFKSSSEEQSSGSTVGGGGRPGRKGSRKKSSDAELWDAILGGQLYP